MQKLAKNYGLSNIALAKVCKKIHNSPAWLGLPGKEGCGQACEKASPATPIAEISSGLN